MIPNSRSNVKCIGKVSLVLSLVVHQNQSRCNIQIGVRRTGIVNFVIAETERNPRRQISRHRRRRIVRTISPGIVPNTHKGIFIAVEIGQQHAVTRAFRHRATTILHARISRVFVLTLLGVISRSLRRPNDTTRRQKFREENVCKFLRNICIISRFFFKCDKVERFPSLVNRCRVKHICA